MLDNDGAGEVEEDVEGAGMYVRQYRFPPRIWVLPLRKRRQSRCRKHRFRNKSRNRLR